MAESHLKVPCKREVRESEERADSRSREIPHKKQRSYCEGCREGGMGQGIEVVSKSYKRQREGFFPTTASKGPQYC